MTVLKTQLQIGVLIGPNVSVSRVESSRPELYNRRDVIAPNITMDFERLRYVYPIYLADVDMIAATTDRGDRN